MGPGSSTEERDLNTGDWITITSSDNQLKLNVDVDFRKLYYFALNFNIDACDKDMEENES